MQRKKEDQRIREEGIRWRRQREPAKKAGIRCGAESGEESRDPAREQNPVKKAGTEKHS